MEIIENSSSKVAIHTSSICLGVLLSPWMACDVVTLDVAVDIMELQVISTIFCSNKKTNHEVVWGDILPWGGGDNLPRFYSPTTGWIWLDTDFFNLSIHLLFPSNLPIIFLIYTHLKGHTEFIDYSFTFQIMYCNDFRGVFIFIVLVDSFACYHAAAVIWVTSLPSSS